MGWNKTYPKGSNQLKEVPQVTQDNWPAIENILGVEHKTFTDPSSGEHILGVAGIVFEGTTAGVSALTGMGSGAMVFDTTLGILQRYDGSAWKRITQDYHSRVRAYKSTTMALTAGASAALVIFDTENYDTLSEYNNTTGIFTAATSGYYLAISSVGVSAAAASGANFPVLGLQIYKNSSVVISVQRPIQLMGAVTNQTINATTILQLNPGDTIKITATITVNNDTLIGDTKYTFLAIHRLGGQGI